MSDVTRILEAAHQDGPKAADQLLPLVYKELRRLAAHKMSCEAPGQTLQPTALVHEAWLRLTGNENLKWTGRAHFFAAAATVSLLGDVAATDSPAWEPTLRPNSGDEG